MKTARTAQTQSGVWVTIEISMRVSGEHERHNLAHAGRLDPTSATKGHATPRIAAASRQRQAAVLRSMANSPENPRSGQRSLEVNQKTSARARLAQFFGLDGTSNRPRASPTQATD